MKDLDIVENQLKAGQVKTIRTGNTIELISLLFSPTTKAQFYYDGDNNNVQIKFSDTDLRIADLAATVDNSVIRELIIALKQLYTQLDNDEEE